ncbi:MAG: hypothetical protein IBX55_08860 [Methyloprofundus sp.]|nr:hypothetical protein [Methyloprofundus sp.]
MTTVSEIVTRFNFLGDLQPLNFFNVGLGDAIIGLGAMGAASMAAGGALFAFVSSTTASIDPMVQLSRETGITLEKIQELGFAASVSGSSSQALQSSLKGLSQRMGEAANGAGEGVKVFERLGIKLRDNEGKVRSASDVFTDLQHSLDGVADAEKISIANKLGLDASLVQLLSQTDQQMSEMTKTARELGIVTQAQGDAAASFNDSLTILGYGMDSVKNSIAVGFAPQMQALVESFTDFLIANRTLFEDGLTVVADGVIVVVDALVRLAPYVAAGIVGFTLFKVATLGFAGAFALLTSPIVVAIAALGAAALVLDDLIVAFDGGESVIRSFFKEFFDVDISKIMAGWADGVNALINNIISGFDELANNLKMIFPLVISDIKSYFSGMFDWVSSKIDGLLGAFKKIGGFFRIDDNTPILQQQPQIDVGAMNVGLSPAPSSTSQTSNNITQEIKISVSSNDPQAAGKAVRDQLQEQLRDTQTQFNRGGR